MLQLLQLHSDTFLRQLVWHLQGFEVLKVGWEEVEAVQHKYDCCVECCRCEGESGDKLTEELVEGVEAIFIDEMVALVIDH